MIFRWKWCQIFMQEMVQNFHVGKGVGFSCGNSAGFSCGEWCGVFMQEWCAIFMQGMMCDFHPRRRILMWKIVQNFHAGTVWYFHAVNGVEFSCRKWGSIFMWEIVQNFHVGK